MPDAAASDAALVVVMTISRVLVPKPPTIGPMKLAYRPDTGLTPASTPQAIPSGTLLIAWGRPANRSARQVVLPGARPDRRRRAPLAAEPAELTGSSRRRPGPGGSVLLGEGLAQLGLLLVRQVGVDQLGVDARERRSHLVHHSIARQQEQRRSARGDLGLDGIDEVVVDPGVGQRTAQRAGGGADGEPEDRDEEQDAEQQSPERAAHGAGAGEAVELTGLRLALAGLPLDGRGVVDVDQLLF